MIQPLWKTKWQFLKKFKKWNYYEQRKKQVSGENHQLPFEHFLPIRYLGDVRQAGEYMSLDFMSQESDLEDISDMEKQTCNVGEQEYYLKL